MTSSILDAQSLMSDIKSHSDKLKEYELAKNYPNANEVVEEIIALLNNHVNKQDQTEDKLRPLKVLLNTYKNKKQSYEYFAFVEEKKKLVRKKMVEKYLESKTKKEELEKENKSNAQQNESIKPEGFELVTPLSNPSSILKEIIEICSGLLKFYELQIKATSDLEIKNDFKPIQTYGSFYIYDRQNNTMKNSTDIMVEKYIDKIKLIKSECEMIVASDRQTTFTIINSLKNDIKIINEENKKLFPKYKKIKEILLDYNIIPKEKKENRLKANKYK